MSVTLHVMCGKAASGKSTVSAQLAAAPLTVLLAEDAWLATLFGEEMTTLQDFVRCSGKLRAAVGPHVVELLRSGVSVVLDFQANTAESRAWMRGLAEAAEATAVLHFMDVSDAECKARLKVRNASGDHPFQLSEQQFDRLVAHFVAPGPSEGFEIISH